MWQILKCFARTFLLSKNTEIGKSGGLTQTKQRRGGLGKSLSVEILAYNKNSLHLKLYDTCLQL